MQQPSFQVRNLLETAVLQLQHSPELSEEEFVGFNNSQHLITGFNVFQEPDALYAPPEEEISLEW